MPKRFSRLAPRPGAGILELGTDLFDGSELRAAGQAVRQLGLALDQRKIRCGCDHALAQVGMRPEQARQAAGVEEVFHQILVAGGPDVGDHRHRAAGALEIVEADLLAGAARQHPGVLIVGLLLSITLMGVAATWIAKLLHRFRWLDDERRIGALPLTRCCDRSAHIVTPRSPRTPPEGAAPDSCRGP